MTTRLYHMNSYVTCFDATVLDVVEYEMRPALVLDKTHFYPTSGGQLHDVGTLAEQRVVDVVAVDGTIYHISADEPAHSLIGQSVTGNIDWSRRYDHMQQHSGQHLLSQACYECFGYETVSVHFGDLEATLDLDTLPLTDEELSEVEHYANQQVYANLAIKCYFVDESKLKEVPLRRPPAVDGTIRIVEIDAFDYSACGGTHCLHTGEIGPIKLVRQSRQNQRTRITFLCGWRALADYANKHRLLVEAARLYDNDISLVPTLIERSQMLARETDRRIDDLTEQLIEFERANLIQSADDIGDYRVITAVYADRSVPAVKKLASSLAIERGHVVLLAVVTNDKLTLIFARSQDLDPDMGALLRQTLQQFGGGGGGRPDMAQGGGASASDAETALAFAKELLASK